MIYKNTFESVGKEKSLGNELILYFVNVDYLSELCYCERSEFLLNRIKSDEVGNVEGLNKSKTVLLEDLVNKLVNVQRLKNLIYRKIFDNNLVKKSGHIGYAVEDKVFADDLFSEDLLNIITVEDAGVSFAVFGSTEDHRVGDDIIIVKLFVIHDMSKDADLIHDHVVDMLHNCRNCFYLCNDGVHGSFIVLNRTDNLVEVHLTCGDIAFVVNIHDELCAVGNCSEDILCGESVVEEDVGIKSVQICVCNYVRIFDVINCDVADKISEIDLCEINIIVI